MFWIIEGAEDMFADRIRAYYTNQNGRLPSNIICYRDGVGDSMYDDVLTKEVAKIESAFASVKTAKSVELAKVGHNIVDKPKITVVIVTKRHRVRFYPDTHVKSQNCEPGTVVESGVTHPCYFGFYLQSHTPVKGTARPTYYVVLRNDMDFDAAQMQDLTNALCYIYARCCLPVGYAPPAYYADRLCEQARLYIKRTSVRNLVDPEPQRPDKVQGESATQRSLRLAAWKLSVKQWNVDIAT
jgi:hypothetical protein